MTNDSRRASETALTAMPIPIRWDPSLPVFAKDTYLEAVGDQCGWIGGFDPLGDLRCILPYTIVRKAFVKMVRFRVETIPLKGELSVAEEKLFLNNVVRHFASAGADVIIPGTNNSIFRTYPDRAIAAPYGSYIVDLRKPEEELWKLLGRKTRQNISKASRDGVIVREAPELVEGAHELIRETFQRSRLPFMEYSAFKRLVAGLGTQGKLLVAEWGGTPESYCLFGFSIPRAYGLYAGNVLNQHQGSNKLLYWTAMCLFRNAGVHSFDFAGARIQPEAGSKQEALAQFKQRFGATLSKGYMWKVPLRPLGAFTYALAVRVLRGGDLVDQERHKMAGYDPGLAD